MTPRRPMCALTRVIPFSWTAALLIAAVIALDIGPGDRVDELAGRRSAAAVSPRLTTTATELRRRAAAALNPVYRPSGHGALQAWCASLPYSYVDGWHCSANSPQLCTMACRTRMAIPDRPGFDAVLTTDVSLHCPLGYHCQPHGPFFLVPATSQREDSYQQKEIRCAPNLDLQSSLLQHRRDGAGAGNGERDQSARRVVGGNERLQDGTSSDGGSSSGSDSTTDWQGVVRMTADVPGGTFSATLLDPASHFLRQAVHLTAELNGEIICTSMPPPRSSDGTSIDYALMQHGCLPDGVHDFRKDDTVKLLLSWTAPSMALDSYVAWSVLDVPQKQV